MDHSLLEFDESPPWRDCYPSPASWTTVLALHSRRRI